MHKPGESYTDKCKCELIDYEHASNHDLTGMPPMQAQNNSVCRVENIHGYAETS